MKNKQPLFYIQDGNHFLDACNGTHDFEWTEQKKFAWKMTQQRCDVYFPRILINHPNAKIVPANRKK